MYWTRNDFPIEIISQTTKTCVTSQQSRSIHSKHEVCIEASSLFPLWSTMFSQPSSNCSPGAILPFRSSFLHEAYHPNENVNLSLRTHISETYWSTKTETYEHPNQKQNLKRRRRRLIERRKTRMGRRTRNVTIRRDIRTVPRLRKEIHAFLDRSLKRSVGNAVVPHINHSFHDQTLTNRPYMREIVVGKR